MQEPIANLNQVSSMLFPRIWEREVLLQKFACACNKLQNICHNNVSYYDIGSHLRIIVIFSFIPEVCIGLNEMELWM